MTHCCLLRGNPFFLGFRGDTGKLITAAQRRCLAQQRLQVVKDVTPCANRGAVHGEPVPAATGKAYAVPTVSQTATLWLEAGHRIAEVIFASVCYLHMERATRSATLTQIA